MLKMIWVLVNSKECFLLELRQVLSVGHRREKFPPAFLLNRVSPRCLDGYPHDSLLAGMC